MTTPAGADAPFEVTPEELRDALAQEAPPLLLDCRQPEEFAICALSGAFLVPMNEIPSRLQELDPDARTIVYCHHGVRSLHVTAFLRQQGFRDVRSLRGGIDRWSLAIDPGVPRY